MLYIKMANIPVILEYYNDYNLLQFFLVINEEVLG